MASSEIDPDFLFCRLEYSVCDGDYLWHHYGYRRFSVGDMFLHGKVSNNICYSIP